MKTSKEFSLVKGIDEGVKKQIKKGKCRPCKANERKEKGMRR